MKRQRSWKTWPQTWKWGAVCAATVVVVPMVISLPGCGGGSNSNGIIPVVETFTTPVQFSNNQSGTLTLRVQGNFAGGDLVVNNATRSRQFTFTIPAGTYAVEGTFTPPRTFRVVGNFPSPLGPFDLNGTIPTEDAPGSFTLNANGQTVTGSIPIPGTTPTPGGTPGVTPGPTQPGGNATATANLLFSQVQGANATTTAITSITAVPQAFFTLNTGGSNRSTFGAVVQSGNAGQVGTRVRTLTLAGGFGGNFAAGIELPVVTLFNPLANSVTIRYEEAGASGTTPFVAMWRGNGGTVRFESVQGRNVTMRLSNVTFVRDTTTPFQAQGSFTLNGTITLSNVTLNS